MHWYQKWIHAAVNMNSRILGNKETLSTYIVSNGCAGRMLAGITLCNNLQNVGATTYKIVLQQPTFLFCNFLQKGLAKNIDNLKTRTKETLSFLFSISFIIF